MLYVFSFVFGAAIGSFLGAILSRMVPDGHEHRSFWKALAGRSQCASCAKILAWYELVSVLSFMVQGGACRSCKAKIPKSIFVIEAITGSVFALIAWRFATWFPVHSAWSVMLPAPWVGGLIAGWWVIASLAILIAFYDALYFLIPNVTLYALIAAAVAMNIVYVLMMRAVPAFPSPGIVFSGTLAYLIGGSTFSVLRILEGCAWSVGLIGGAYALTRGRGMGFGDVLIALAFGILFGWPDVLLVLFAAFVLGTVVSLFLLIARRKTMKSLVPFGPFLMLGALTTILFGVTLTSLYLGLFPGLLMS